MAGRAALLRLVPAILLALLPAACVPPAPLTVTGSLPHQTAHYALVSEDLVSPSARAALAGHLGQLGLTPVEGGSPDLFVSIALADRPLSSGTFTSDAAPPSRTADGWVDRPVKGGLFSRGRREVRLTIRFLSPSGDVRDQFVATEVVARKAAPADLTRMIDAAFNARAAGRFGTVSPSPGG